MNTYLLIKTLHIISATLLVGTGFGTAFYMFWVNRSGSVAAQSVVARWVVRADWWFTTPTVIFQVASGTWMIWQAGWPWSAKWIWMTLALYAFAGLCWLPVVWLQLQMAKIAREADAAGAREMSPRYRTLARRWELLGYPAFCATVVIYFLMVFKPV